MHESAVIRLLSNKHRHICFYDHVVEEEACLLTFNERYSISSVSFTPNHIYYVNRAMAYFEIGELQACIDDCVVSRGIDEKYVGSYMC